MNTDCPACGSVSGNSLDAARRVIGNMHQFWNPVTHNVLLRDELHTCHS
jgi:hypothetical protein